MPPTRAAVYARISSDRAGAGLGVERQETEARALCAARGWEVVETFVDNDLSAYSGKPRPGYRALLEAVERGELEAVVAWHPDRLHRSPVELEAFIDLIERRRVAVATVQGGEYDLATASGRMTARVVGAVARHESEHKSERLRAKAAQLAAAGEVGNGGRRPFGYAADRVTVDELEAAVVRELAARVLAGEALGSIAADLNRRGVPTTAGGEWRPSTLRNMLRAPRLAGLRAHRGRVVGPAVWPAIIPPETHARLVALFDDPARARRPVARRYLLTGGLAVCSACGVGLTAARKDTGRAVYRCKAAPGSRACGRVSIGAEALEAYVVDSVLAALDAELLADHDAASSSSSSSGPLAELAAAEARLEELAVDWAEGRLDRRAWLAAQDRLAGRLEELRAQAAAAVRLEGAPRRPAELAGPEWWAGLELGPRRAVLEAVLEVVRVAPAVRGRNWFDPDRVELGWRW